MDLEEDSSSEISERGVLQVESHLSKLDVGSLPGVGWSTKHKLEGMGIHSVTDLRLSRQDALQQELGAKNGAMVWCASIRCSKQAL
jgi:nucleotidyltransferase/DNA polymerase involved in DNA repair